MSQLRLHSHFVFRSPAFPFSKVIEISELVKEPFFLEAIYLASPQLYSETQRWLKGELKSESEIRKVITSLEKYASRMRSRCTPYGIFASCGTGVWSERNKIIIDDDRIQRCRLDMDFLCSLIQNLEQYPAIRSALSFRPNNSIYRIGDKFRYVEYQYVGEKRNHKTSSVDASDYLIELLEFSASGKRFSDLVNFLSNTEVSIEEASEFIDELIKNQIVVSDLDPSITGGEILQGIIDKLKDVQSLSPDEHVNNVLRVLSNINIRLKASDKEIKIGNEEYQKIVDEVRKLNIPFEEKYLFQVDSFINGEEKTIGNDVGKKLQDAINFLNRLSPVYSSGDLDSFKKRFIEFYEQREMPLLSVLDVETGIGYPNRDVSGINPLVDDLGSAGSHSNGSNVWNQKDAVLLNKLIEAKSANQYTVHFSNEDAKGIPYQRGQLSPSLSVMFKVADSERSTIQIKSVGGNAGGAALLGRFAYGDERIREIMDTISDHEDRSYEGKIIAEIVHQPDDRVGNILIRPNFRKYEIPYLAKASVVDDYQILPHDLLISVRGNRIVLRSKKTDKEIIPRLSCAHNYSYRSLPLYKFLCDLQLQDVNKSSLQFHWGSLAGIFKFLPRAEYNGVTLFPATWNLGLEDYSALRKAQKDGDLVVKTMEWRSKWKMPRYLVQKDGDNELLIDLESEKSVRTFLDAVKKRSFIELSEFIFDPECALVKDQQGNPYTNEIIAILFNDDFKSPTYEGSFVKAESAEVKRSFVPGSEWLYYKIYCGVKTADSILGGTIMDLVEELNGIQLVEKWFFIRYSDPDSHIRLRFYNSDSRKNAEVWKIAAKYFQPLIEQGIVTKVMTDTYARELERYGSNTIDLVESSFFMDSCSVLQFLSGVQGEEGEELKWKYVLKSVDALINCFKFSGERKMAFLENFRSAYFREHGGHKNLKVVLDIKYRKMRSNIENVLTTPQPFDSIVHWQKKQLQSIVDQFLKLESSGKLEIRLEELISSFVHMTVNRIFKARQRTHEMVIYHLLHKHYSSELARAKKGTYSAK